MHYQIAPHGNELINRVLTGARRDFWQEKAESLPSITLDKRKVYDVMMIADGAYSPLEGFMGSEDYTSVLNKMRLPNGLPWPIPIVLGYMTHHLLSKRHLYFSKQKPAPKKQYI